MKLVKKLKRLKEELENRLQRLYDCYGDLSTTGLDADIRKKITAKYRFYTYRASILSSPGIIPVIKKILPSPWLYNITVLRSYPALIPDLVRILENESSEYLKYVAIWALGEMKPNCSNAVSALTKILFFDESLGIKLMASQSLLKIDYWDGFDWERLEQEILKMQKIPRLLKNLILIWGRSGSDKLKLNWMRALEKMKM
ncbi:MAG: HEAT repeat domain-containing protein [Firmicutes bacterium]|nr:HEAT repeat domain-containing protein [Bacillota bacterium]